MAYMDTSSKTDNRPTKDDIAKMLHYLRVTQPRYATTENAVKLLDYCKGYYEELEEHYPEKYRKLLQS